MVAEVLASTGQPLDRSVRSRMEGGFSHDLSDVRVHTDARAAQSARALTARAYTFGRNVVFGADQYRPGSRQGERILAHELAHVVQQQAVPGNLHQATSLAVTADPLEQEAHTAAEVVSGGGRTLISGRVTSDGVIQRDTIEVELEQVAPAEQEKLRRQGIQLPGTSAAAVDPRRRNDYIDNRMTAVGFSIYLGGYLVYCDGLPLPLFLPDSHAALGLANAQTLDATIYLTRAEAVAALPTGPPTPAPLVTYYSGAGGAVIVPTLFSPATTPQIVECALRARRELAQQVQRELVVLAVALVGGMAVRALLNRIALRGGGGPKPPKAPVVTESGEAFGARMAREMSEAGYKGNPYREFMQRMNALPQRLPPQEAADAIRVATKRFTNGMEGTMPPVQVGDILVVPSRAPIPNAPVMGIRADGTVIMGRAPRIEIVTQTAEGAPLPLQAKIHGQITWE
ncbi:DUF4157 domain-containing protein [Streptomyces sp. NPDC127077]|uniref:eCIS core domain-containing protein n=1 Tax=Streptomyces sp. NPDC127077 TaxID=3347131 RepID=UPI00364A06FB